MVDVILSISKPASASALAMAETELRGVSLCSIVTTDVTTFGDTQTTSSPHVSRITSLMVETHDGQCRFETRYEVVALWRACGGVLPAACRRGRPAPKRVSGQRLAAPRRRRPAADGSSWEVMVS
jgi:hypothetical protein